MQVPKDQVLREPPPDRARRYKKLAGQPARRRRLRRACCLSCAALLAILLAAAAFAGAVCLAFRPRAPSFSVPLTLEARVPVRLRFGKVLRTWTVHVRARCEVAVDRLDGDATAVNRGCRVRVKPLWWWW